MGRKKAGPIKIVLDRDGLKDWCLLAEKCIFHHDKSDNVIQHKIHVNMFEAMLKREGWIK